MMKKVDPSSDFEPEAQVPHPEAYRGPSTAMAVTARRERVVPDVSRPRGR